MRQYKFQALVKLYDDGDSQGGRCGKLGPAPRRMVLRGHNEETRRSEVFTALVSCDDEGPFRPGSARMLVTLRLAGDNVADYLGVGSHFDLWLGNDIGDGVVTRRLFI